MENLISTFHIDARILIAQAVNFGIVFSILYFFALKPLIATMKDRTEKIEKSINDAKHIDIKLAETQENYQKTIIEAKKEASELLEKARQDAELRKTEIVNKAKEEIGVIINQEKETVREEKTRVIKEIKKEVADLVALSIEKILGEKMDAGKDKEVIKKIIG